LDGGPTTAGSAELRHEGDCKDKLNEAIWMYQSGLCEENAGDVKWIDSMLGMNHKLRLLRKGVVMMELANEVVGLGWRE
jgi:hypothetical protein